MTTVTVSWIVAFVLSSICLLVLTYRVYTLNKHNGIITLPIAKMVIATVLALVAIGTATVSPTIPWLNILGICSFIYSLYLIYLIINQMFNNIFIPTFNNRLFIVTVIIILTIIFLGYSSKDNLNSFLNSDESFNPTFKYYLYNYLSFGFLTYLCMINSLSAVRRLRWNQDPTITIRYILVMLTYASSTVAFLIVLLNLVLSHIYGATLRSELNQLYHIMKMPAVPCMVFAILPQQFFAPVRPLLDRYVSQRMHRHHLLLNYLHGRMIQIVPSIHLDNELLRNLRALIEISDARLIIMSHLPQQPPDPKDEARYLHRLLMQRCVIDTPGPYTPCAPPNVIKHNLAVAKHLMRLEQKTITTAPSSAESPIL